MRFNQFLVATILTVGATFNLCGAWASDDDSSSSATNPNFGFGSGASAVHVDGNKACQQYINDTDKFATCVKKINDVLGGNPTGQSCATAQQVLTNAITKFTGSCFSTDLKDCVKAAYMCATCNHIPNGCAVGNLNTDDLDESLQDILKNQYTQKDLAAQGGMSKQDEIMIKNCPGIAASLAKKYDSAREKYDDYQDKIAQKNQELRESKTAQQQALTDYKKAAIEARNHLNEDKKSTQASLDAIDDQISSDYDKKNKAAAQQTSDLRAADDACFSATKAYITTQLQSDHAKYVNGTLGVASTAALINRPSDPNQIAVLTNAYYNNCVTQQPVGSPGVHQRMVDAANQNYASAIQSIDIDMQRWAKKRGEAVASDRTAQNYQDAVDEATTDYQNTNRAEIEHQRDLNQQISRMETVNKGLLTMLQKTTAASNTISGAGVSGDDDSDNDTSAINFNRNFKDMQQKAVNYLNCSCQSALPSDQNIQGSPGTKNSCSQAQTAACTDKHGFNDGLNLDCTFLQTPLGQANTTGSKSSRQRYPSGSGGSGSNPDNSQ